MDDDSLHKHFRSVSMIEQNIVALSIEVVAKVHITQYTMMATILFRKQSSSFLSKITLNMSL